MYYSYCKDDSRRPNTFSTWRDIKYLEYWSYEDKTFMGKGIYYTNRINKVNKGLINSKNDEISISFLAVEDDTNGEMYVSYSKSLLNNQTIELAYSYNVNNNTLKRDTSMIIDNDFVSEDIIDKYLKDNNYDKELLYDELDNILYNQMLDDWIEFYDSRFSMNNLGGFDVSK